MDIKDTKYQERFFLKPEGTAAMEVAAGGNGPNVHGEITVTGCDGSQIILDYYFSQYDPVEYRREKLRQMEMELEGVVGALTRFREKMTEAFNGAFGENEGGQE